MVIANLLLCASLAIYHLISKARSWNNFQVYPYNAMYTHVFSTFVNPIILPVYPPPQKKKLHMHCFLFLFGHLHVPREIEYDHCVKFWRVNTMYHWIWENRELSNYSSLPTSRVNSSVSNMPVHPHHKLCTMTIIVIYKIVDSPT